MLLLFGRGRVEVDGSDKATFTGAEVLAVAALTVGLAVVLEEESRVEALVAHDTGKTVLMVDLGERADDLLDMVDRGAALGALGGAWDGESGRHYGTAVR